MNFKKINIISKNNLEIELYDDNTNIEVFSKGYDKFEFYMNGIKKDFSKEQEEEIYNFINESININELKLVIANEDYDKIFSKLSYEDIYIGYHYKKELIIKKLSNDIQTFIKYEYYEKCIILKNILNFILSVKENTEDEFDKKQF